MLRSFALVALLFSASSARATEQGPPAQAGDERLFFSPTGRTLPQGAVELSDDELLLLHLGVGVSRRVQLDLFAGGFPLPPVGGVLPFAGLAAGGAAGLVGAVDLGVKVRLVDEGVLVPAIAASYDLLDLFGAGVGAGAVAGGGGAGAGVGLAGVNAQLNLLQLVATKRFGEGTELTAGLRVLDNHNFLPQSASFAGVGTDASGQVGGATSGEKLAHLPTVVRGFVAAGQRLGPHSQLAVEVYPASRLVDSYAITGVRWIVGPEKPWGLLPVDKLRFRIDLAAVWVWFQPTGTNARPGLGALPLVGVGLYFI